jgi:hypothetical protein
MGFRFQKRIKLLPGVRLNVSKSGLSTSVGVTGARVTYGHGKKRTTVGVPGSGISHTAVESCQSGQAGAGSRAAASIVGALIGLIAALFSGGRSRRRR